MTRRSNLRTPVLVSIVMMAFLSPAAAKVIYVDANAPGPTHDGSSWTNAYKYLQDAITDANSAAKPVEIQVAQGIYTPDSNSANPNGSGDRYATFQLINSVSLTGGYAGFGEPDPNARDIGLYETILNGDLAGNDADVNEARELLYDPCRGENSYIVVYANNTDVTSVLDGFTITACNDEFSFPPSKVTGGMYNLNANPTVTNCTFSANVAFMGSGMYNLNANPTVTNCTFSANAAFNRASGMYNFESNPALLKCTFTKNFESAMGNRESSPTVTNCIFSQNWAPYSTGGMHNLWSNPTVTNCTFTDNTTHYLCGGMYNDMSSPTVTNCTFVDNTADAGGGILNIFNSSPTVTNCTFADNTADKGGGILNLENCYPTVTNCIIRGNGPDEIFDATNCSTNVTYSNIQGGWAGAGGNNIDADPCFADTNNGDYHLKSQAGRWDANSESWVQDYVSSPCIDAGNPGCPIGDEPAPNGNRKNMGAYGGTAEASKSPTYWRSIADMTNDWIVDSNDLKVFADYWLQMGECLPGDFDRNQSVDFNDFAILGEQWRQEGPGPGITYDIGGCIPVDLASSALLEFEPTRFTVTVEGRYIYFEDTMRANCCPEELELQMTWEGDLITIYEIEHTPMPCPCLCDFPITATFGPFEPGTYIFAVYQNSSFIGSTTVTIENGQ